MCYFFRMKLGKDKQEEECEKEVGVQEGMRKAKWRRRKREKSDLQ